MIVADAGPVISLARIERLGLLHELYDEVLIPPAVDDEITRHPDGFGGPRPVWVRTLQLRDGAAAAALMRPMHAGEAEAIVLSQEQGRWLLIDEATGRKVAVSSGIQVIGTLGVLLDAKRAGLIPQLDAVLVRLRQTGFRASDELLEGVLRAAGER